MLLLRPLITLCVLLSNLKVGTVLKFGSENRKTTQYHSTCCVVVFHNENFVVIKNCLFKTGKSGTWRYIPHTLSGLRLRYLILIRH